MWPFVICRGGSSKSIDRGSDRVKAPVAYLECGKRGPGGLGDGSPPVGSRGKAPVWGLGDEVPQKLKFFVNECLNFDVLE